ncbi:MAG: helix-turn-helix transcriptional regulator, partial [Oscillospiraceae bacterium]|nr:helix-turn-helix transcriptional regulator [Oscillospiraceae bacterium]
MKPDVAGILSYLRRKSGQNQREAAAGLGISQALLSHYENGVREPRLEFIVRACEYYGVSSDFMLGRTDIERATVSGTSSEWCTSFEGALDGENTAEFRKYMSLILAGVLSSVKNEPTAQIDAAAQLSRLKLRCADTDEIALQCAEML